MFSALGDSMNTQVKKLSENKNLDLALRVLLVLSLLFIFLVGIKVLGGSFKLMGGGFAKGLISATSNPIISLFSGMFATVLIQSSSVTTSLIVGLVASGTLPLSGAIPMIMGANLGTSVTNSLVSLGYIKNQKHFRDAFAAATVHDFFNILTVAVLLPIELMTGYLEKSAVFISSLLYGSMSGYKFSSPIKAAIKPVAGGIKTFVVETLGITGTASGVALCIISAAIIIFALTFIVKTMKVVVESNKGEIVNNLLAKNGYVAILFGTLLTISVQSSSITTSLLVPMAGAGVLSLRSILPVTIGANIGTTTTALLAALAGNATGLAIALVHFLFNISGMLLWYVHPKMRSVPLILCEKLADMTLRNRINGLAYIIGVFFIIPMIITVIL
jgi:sodium-dependent phosphate cotransporter